jgi:NAD(P)-dependent dehydrogenase (short-subunit alcohol dehydrogenase family)
LPTALITGASRGIGAAAARRFADADYDLLLIARPSVELDSLVQELRTPGRTVEFAGLNLTDQPAIRPVVEELCQRGPAPDVVINNAGGAWTGPLADMPLAQWQWLIQLNLTSVFLVCQATLPLLRQGGGGRIINVSSHAARNAFPDWGAYCVSKAALDSLSRCLAVEEQANGIQVSTLTLGAVNTPLWDSETVHSSFDRRAMIPPAQAAEALLFLAQQPTNQTITDLTLMPSAGAL